MSIVKRYTCLATLISLSLAAASAQADVINGYFTNPRVYNDNPGSTLTITPAAPINVNPATITIRDEWTTPAGWANRHDVLASSDGGATAYTFGIDSSFIFTTRLTLTCGLNSPAQRGWHPLRNW